MKSKWMYAILRIIIIVWIGSLNLDGQSTLTHPTTGPEKGSLLVVGGAAKSDVFVPIFMELAGGMDAKIVVIPTAAGERSLARDGALERYLDYFKREGAKNVTILHTMNPEEANKDAFVADLKDADGVWFGGGRQWRLVDAYMGTKVQVEIMNLLNRGGVVGGSSAGATIQGSYLIRGDTKANTIIMGDHEKGLGFIKNVAIDQHLLARNRHFDMFELLEKRPELLGIGLDENTGIVVKGNTFEVVGKSYVAIYDNSRWSAERRKTYSLDGKQQFYFLKPGQQYNLLERKVIIPD